MMNSHSRTLARMLPCAALALLQGFGCQNHRTMDITRNDYGSVQGRPVHLYTIRNANGMTAEITNYGAIITELHVPGADGEMTDIVLGFDTLDEYRESNPYFGAMVGRVGNRIAGAEFQIDGREYVLHANNGPNHLHGGLVGFDKVVWDAVPVITPEGKGLELTYVSEDGEEGYPGTLEVTVLYIINDENQLKVVSTATTDEATPVNIVHHSYWNMSGHDSGDVLDQVLTINADAYTPVDSTMIPTGHIDPVLDTPFDFREPMPIGSRIDQLPPTGDDPGGYDINYVVDREDQWLQQVAVVTDPVTGLTMIIESSEPGVQFYSGNFLDSVPGKSGAVYGKHHGFCLETQKYPDAINRQGEPGWPCVILQPGEQYRHVMVHTFLPEPPEPTETP